MKYLYPFLFLLLLVVACQNEKPSQEEPPISKEATKTEVEKIDELELKLRSDCRFEGEILEGNRKKLDLFHQEMVIAATSSTQDVDFGESHRAIQVIDLLDCTTVFEEELPVNRSPDFPYYFTKINYNNTNHVVAIKGFDQMYCYNVIEKKLLPVLKPSFKQNRELVDAQSGRIMTLELWENYMIGFAQDQGAFVFDLTDLSNIQAIKPFCEYQFQGTDRFSSLFLLKSADGKTQLLFPDYDYESDQFNLNPLFNAPVSLDGQKRFTSDDQQFAILWKTGKNTPFAVDLKTQKLETIPPALQTASPSKILSALQKG